MLSEKAKCTQAEVRLRGQRVGQLSKFSNDSFVFTYDELYRKSANAVAISVNFPLDKSQFTSARLHAFFDNLIMEGWLLSHAEKYFLVDKKNRWALLMLVGSHPIGAVSVHALDNHGKVIEEADEKTELKTEFETEVLKLNIPSHNQRCSFCLKLLKAGEHYHMSCYKKLWGTSKALKIKLHKSEPLLTFSLTIHDGSISGAQRKGLFTLNKNTLEVSSSKSNYILKPDGDYPELPANEHFTMLAAKKFNFEVPPIGLLEIENLGLVLAIKRFDQTKNGQKLLIEDMAQINEEFSDDKYSLSHEKIGASIRAFTQAGPLNLNDFFRRIVFCYLTANGDMHLKNWSLLEMENNFGTYRLCPVYDWLNTRIALPIEKFDLAIPLAGKQKKMQRSYFREFALDSLQLNKTYVESVFKEVPNWTNEIASLLPHSYLSPAKQSQYSQLLHERSQVFK